MSQSMIGAFMIVGAHIVFSVNFSIVTYLTSVFSVPQLMVFRFAFAPMILLPFLIKRGITCPRPGMLILRAVFGISAMTCLYFGFKFGSPGQVTLIFLCSVIWTFIISHFFIKDKPHLYSIIACFVAFIGLFLICRPDLYALSKGSLFALLGSVLNVGVILSLKSLRRDHDSMSILIVFCCIATPILWPFADMSFDLLTSQSIPWILSVGTLSLIAQLLMTEGFKYCKASISASFSLIEVPLMYTSGLIFFSEELSALGIVGVVLVMIGIGVVSRYQ